jgi:hypothetical protein
MRQNSSTVRVMEKKSWADIADEEEEKERIAASEYLPDFIKHRCYAMTKQGRQCKKVVIGKPTCAAHIAQCKNKRKDLKRTCSQSLWEDQCDDRMSNAQLQAYKKRFLKCADKRGQYQYLCVEPQCRDEGHEYAINKMLSQSDRCGAILTRRTSPLRSSAKNWRK